MVFSGAKAPEDNVMLTIGSIWVKMPQLLGEHLTIAFFERYNFSP